MHVKQRAGISRLLRPVSQRRLLVNPISMAAGYFLLLALFGGGPVDWTPAYILLVAATIIISSWLAWRDGFSGLYDIPIIGRIALIGIAIISFLQLIPLPSFLWQILPGQKIRFDVLNLVGLSHSYQPLTLDPTSTASTAIMAVGFVVLVLLLVRLNDDNFSKMLNISLIIVGINIAVGVMQVVSAGQFLQIHPVHMGATMLGFYANKNHMGLVIACAMVLFCFVNGRKVRNVRHRRLMVVGAVIFAIVCILTTNSRAALIFGMIGVFVVLLDLMSQIKWKYCLTVLAALTFLGFVALSALPSQVVIGRFGDIDSDLRWNFTQWSWPIVKQYWIFGSGAGSFALLFAANEQLDWVKPTFVNAVHDDYIQLVLEFGLPGIIVLALLSFSLVKSAFLAWGKSSKGGQRRSELLFALTVLLMIALHSSVDYPLRRPACWIFLALAIAAIYRSRNAVQSWPTSAGRNQATAELGRDIRSPLQP